MNHLQRIGISLDSNLLSQFDDLIAKQGYANRSEAVRDLVRKSLSAQELAKPNTKAIAGVFLVYDHHATKLGQKLTDLQHHHLLQIVSSVHVHLDRENCLEIIIMKGKVGKIQKIADSMASLKGVKLSRLNLLTTGAKLT